jgi:hypothetical protein
LSSNIVNHSRNSHAWLQTEFNVSVLDAEKVPQILAEVERFVEGWALADTAFCRPKIGVTGVDGEKGLKITVDVKLGTR